MDGFTILLVLAALVLVFDAAAVAFGVDSRDAFTGERLHRSFD